MTPLPFACLHSSYLSDAEDDHGNAIPKWSDPPASVPCFWWSPSSAEPLGNPTGSDQVSVDVMLVVDSTVQVDHRDRFTVDGHDFEVIGLPKDYDHGPFGFAPNRRVLELKWVG